MRDGREKGRKLAATASPLRARADRAAGTRHGERPRGAASPGSPGRPRREPVAEAGGGSGRSVRKARAAALLPGRAEGAAGRRRVLAGVSVGLLAVAFGGVLYGVDRAHHGSVSVAHVADTPRGGSGSDAVLPAHGAAAARPGSGPAPLARSTPLTLAIPSVRLSAPLLGLGMDGKGAAELPPFSLPRTAGWLRDSASPGEAGTAVVVGHVDTTTGPAVFWNLAAVRTGAEVDVARLDGRTAVFTVDRVREYPKAAFPTAQVYGPSPGAQLRVVTCGGGFDRARREYTGNVVLFAHLSGVR